MAKKKRKIDYRYNLKLYFELLQRYKFMFLLLVIVSLILESSKVVDKFLFKVIIDQGTLWTAGSIAKESLISALFIVVAVFLGVSAIKPLFQWLYLHLINLLEVNLIADLKRRFFNHILSLSYQFHATHRTGSLISRLVRGGRSVEAMSDVIIFNFLPMLFQLIIVSSAMFYFDWKPAAVVLGTVFIFILYSYLIQWKQQKYNLLANDAEDWEKANISDFFMNIESIKYFGKENRVMRKFFQISEKTKRAFRRYWDYFRWLDAGQSLILAGGTFFVVYFPLMDFLKGDTTLGTLTFIYTAFGNLLPSLYWFVRGMRDFFRVMADFESLFRYSKIRNEIQDSPRAKELKIKDGAVEFRDITFGYRKRKIFSNFNLKIHPGEKIALVGHSGSGKTTLIKLLYRLYDVQKGAIFIDGQEIKKVRQESLRSELSIVPQECVLFDDTIYNNILFSHPRASRREVFRAIRFAQLDNVIKDFPQKERTIVGERGVKLSGGEKQRVSIARALLADKKVLVLDEATSSLDSKTEHEIQAALQRLMKGRTSIIIAHRLSTIMKADKIVVLDKGRIVQLGRHTKLIAQPGVYQQLWNLQKGGYIR